MNRIINGWRSDKLKTALTISWLLTVFFSFFGSAIQLADIPGIGVLYPFRILLPITAGLYFAWSIREKRNLWKYASFTQRVCYVLCAILVVHSGLSLFWAIDSMFTFRMFFNLCFDLVLFFLMLDLCSDRQLFIDTIHCILISFLIQIALGIAEVFFGSFFNPKYGAFRGFSLSLVGHQVPLVATDNQNDYSMMLIFGLALLLIYWAWYRQTKKCDWIPVVLFAPIYFLTCVAEARLCWLTFWILFAGFVCYVLSLGGKQRWILLLTVLLLLVSVFRIHHESILSGINTLLPTASAQGTESVVSEETDEISEAKQPPIVPGFDDLKSEFFEIDEETGEVRLNRTLSGGNRLALLLHAWDCFVQSKGMGVGLGNTEQLTGVNWKMVWDIHCFLARMGADFGIWFLIPMFVIAFKMLQFGFECFQRGRKSRNWTRSMFGVLYLTAVVVYPIASCSPGDAQDALIMWLFLAGMVLFPVHMKKAEYPDGVEQLC